MGIDIVQKKVILNPTHDKLLITNPFKNPTTTKKGDLIIRSVYTRTKRGGRHDGNPFIYALKGMHGYSIDLKQLYEFRSSANEILDKIVRDVDCDYVAPMPSSHYISLYLSRKISRKLRLPIIPDLFKKITVKQLVAQFDLDSIPKNHYKTVRKQLSIFTKKQEKFQISLKEIPNRIRKYFSPVELNPAYSNSPLTGTPLLVDDLLSTGTTLRTAQSKLLKKGIVCRNAVCLLSDLK